MGNQTAKQSEGYHVLKIHPGSPAETAGLVPYFDFILRANDVVLNSEEVSFSSIVEKEVDKEVKLVVYNSKTDTVREAVLVPRRNWGGPGMIGVTVRFASFKGAHENVWHVLDVYPNSPAATAGLRPYTDYVIGAPELVFNDSEDFFMLVQNNIGKQIQLYVYNAEEDAVRTVTIVPSNDWGGNGCLGCDVGFGYLHRIPVSAQQKAAVRQSAPPPQPKEPPVAASQPQTPQPQPQPIPSSQPPVSTQPTTPPTPTRVTTPPTTSTTPASPPVRAVSTQPTTPPTQAPPATITTTTTPTTPPVPVLTSVPVQPQPTSSTTVSASFATPSSATATVLPASATPPATTSPVESLVVAAAAVPATSSSASPSTPSRAQAPFATAQVPSSPQTTAASATSSAPATPSKISDAKPPTSPGSSAQLAALQQQQAMLRARLEELQKKAQKKPEAAATPNQS